MTPIEMRLQNFGPYEDTVLRFDFSLALIIGEHEGVAGGSNGSGKSLIFQALAWVLTGYSDFKKTADLVRLGQDQAKVTLLFSVKEKIYRITRTQNRNGKLSLDFVHVGAKADGTDDPVKADTNSLLDDKIASVTKITYGAFVNTTYFAQNSISDFVSGNSSTRQKLVAEILSLMKWSWREEAASKKLKEEEKNLAVLRMRHSQFSGSQNNLGLRMQDLAADTSSLTLVKSKLKSNAPRLQKVRANLTDAVRLLKEAELRDSLAGRKTQLETRRSSIVARLGGASTSVATYEAEIAKLVFDVTAVELPASMESSSAFEANLNVGRAKLSMLKQQLAASKAGDCTACGFKWGEHDHEADDAARQAEIDRISTKLAAGEAQLATLKLNETRALQATRLIEKLNSKIDTNKSFLAIARTSEAEARADLTQLERELSEVVLKLATLPEVEVVDSATLIEEEKALSLESEELQKQKEKLIASIAALEAQIAILNEQIKDSAIVGKQVTELETKVNTLTSLVKNFGKAGIQAAILDSMIGEIEKVANEYLARFTYKPMTIKFITQKIDTKGQPKETLDMEFVTTKGTLAYENLSGGEKLRVAFATRLALAAMQAKRLGGEVQLLLLDEVTSSLDDPGMRTFVEIIQMLRSSMKIMVIDHDDKLKEHFDDVITVSNKDGIAAIRQ